MAATVASLKKKVTNLETKVENIDTKLQAQLTLNKDHVRESGHKDKEIEELKGTLDNKAEQILLGQEQLSELEDKVNATIARFEGRPAIVETIEPIETPDKAMAYIPDSAKHDGDISLIGDGTHGYKFLWTGDTEDGGAILQEEKHDSEPQEPEAVALKDQNLFELLADIQVAITKMGLSGPRYAGINRGLVQAKRGLKDIYKK